MGQIKFGESNRVKITANQSGTIRIESHGQKVQYMILIS